MDAPSSVSLAAIVDVCDNDATGLVETADEFLIADGLPGIEKSQKGVTKSEPPSTLLLSQVFTPEVHAQLRNSG